MGSANARLFAGAKEVSVVGVNFPFGPGGYNEALHLNHFDLLIDWGWFYFITQARMSWRLTFSSSWSATLPSRTHRGPVKFCSFHLLQVTSSMAR